MTEKKTMNETAGEKMSAEKMSAGDRLAQNAAYAGKPGQQYVSAFLPHLSGQADAGWLAERIDDGSLLACPHCHFLHLPSLPLPLGLRKTDPLPATACDVCAFVPLAGEFEFSFEDLARTLADAPSRLEDARQARAMLFYDLWMGAVDGAALWLYARMQQTVAESVAFARQPVNGQNLGSAKEGEA